MKIRHFLDHIEHDRVRAAIQAAERGTSGRIVVYISHRRVHDALKSAHKTFCKLHLETAESKTGLLLFVAPVTRKFAVLGGTALHDKLGQAWWDHLSERVGRHFKEERYTDGILATLEEAGQSLKTHFPDAHSTLGRPEVIED